MFDSVKHTPLILTSMTVATIVCGGNIKPASPTYSPQIVAQQRTAAVSLIQELKKTIASGKKQFTIKSGIYRFDNSFNLKKLDGMTIDGQGAEFIFTLKKGGMRLIECQNTTVKNIFLDIDPLPFIQGTVIEVNANSKTIDIKLDPGYPDYFKLAGNNKKNMRCIFFDPEGKKALDINDSATKPPRQVSPGVLRIDGPRVFYPRKRALKQGDRVVINMRYGGGGIRVEKCSNITLENISIYAAGGFGIHEYGIGNGGNIYKGCKIIRRPDTSRLMAGASDGFHSMQQKKGPKLLGCEISYTFDDLINIHGFQQFVINKKSSTEMIIGGPFEQDFTKGSTLYFYSSPDAKPLGKAIVVECTKLTDCTQKEIEKPIKQYFKEKFSLRIRSFSRSEPCLIKLDRPIPAEQFDLVCSRDYAGSGAIIENCILHDGNIRGVLLKSPNTLVKNCRIERTARSGIVIKPEIYWLEGPFPDGIKIINNTLIDCGFGAISKKEKYSEIAPIAVLSNFSKRLFPPLFTSSVNMKNIEISGNNIINAPGPGIIIFNAANVVVNNNVIVNPAAKYWEFNMLDLTANLINHGEISPTELSVIQKPYYGILIMSSENIHGSGNQVKKSANYCRGTVGVGPWTKNISFN